MLHNFREDAEPWLYPVASLDVRPVRDESERDGAWAVRERVFCGEQGVNHEEEFDALDAEATHVVAVALNGYVAGTCRLLSGRPARTLGRLAVEAELRGRGVGEKIVREAERIAADARAARIELNAQTRATSFYQKSGYLIVRGPFDEAGIEHVRMHKEIG